MSTGVLPSMRLHVASVVRGARTSASSDARRWASSASTRRLGGLGECASGSRAANAAEAVSRSRWDDVDVTSRSRAFASLASRRLPGDARYMRVPSAPAWTIGPASRTMSTSAGEGLARQSRSPPWSAPCVPRGSPAGASSLLAMPTRRQPSGPLHPSPSATIIRHFATGGSGYGGRSSRGAGAGPSFRQRFDRIPPNYIVYGIIGINVGVFLLWQYATASWQRFRDPALYNWLARNFVVSEMNLAAGRVYTLLTGCFSHSTGSHILLNCLGLYFIAPSVVSLLGPSAFLALYTGGGIISSLVSLGWHRFITGGRGPKRGSEGASGAIYAALSFYATMFPYQQFLLFFIVPVPAWAAVGGIFAYDLYSSIRSPYAMTDSAGHVGGILAGVIFALASKGRRGGPRSPPWRR